MHAYEVSLWAIPLSTVAEKVSKEFDKVHSHIHRAADAARNHLLVAVLLLEGIAPVGSLLPYPC